MSATHLKGPAACSEDELATFERLVRLGFAGSDAGLADRVRSAHRLAFHRPARGSTIAIAGLKAPGPSYRRDIFARAGVAAHPADYPLELGWVFVAPEQRGKGLAAELCRKLLEDAPASWEAAAGVCATTRPDNAPMLRVLRALNFSAVGDPFPHMRRNEDLALFLRASP